MALKKNIGLVGLLFASVSGIIGSGWLFAPFYASRAAGPAALIAWVVGAVLIISIALCFAEVSAMFPLSGGVVRFIQFTHGSPISFIVSWVNWLSFVIIPAIEVQATLQYSEHFSPGLVMEAANGTHPLTHFGIFIAACLMLLFTVLNIIGVKLVTKLNSIVVFWKLLIPLIAVTTLLITNFHAKNFVAAGGFAPYGLTGIFKAITIGGIVFSFTGFRQAVELAGEAANPKRSIPIAVIGSILICLVIYFFLQFAFIGALSPKDIVNGWQQLTFVGDSAPLVGIASAVGIIWLVSLLYIDAIVSPAGTGLIATASTARILYAMSVSGFLPKRFSETNRFGVPAIAIVINFIVGMSFFLPFPDWQSMMEILASVAVLAYAVGPLCLLSFRLQLPTIKRPFSLPAGQYIASFAFIVCNLIIIWTGWHTVKSLIILIMIGCVLMGIYFVYRCFNDHKLAANAKRELYAGFWFIPYLAGLAIISYLSIYGGGIDFIPIGWDIAVVAVFSLLIFWLAIATRLPKQITEEYINSEPAVSVHYQRLTK